MSEELTPLQIDARQTKCALCEEIGIRGCGGCPLDKIRREKDTSCDKIWRNYPMLVIEAANQHKNATEQPKANPQGETKSIKTDWEATAKRLQKENKRLQDELSAERQRSAQMEKELTTKDKLKERIVGQRDAYLNVVAMLLDQDGGDNGI